MIRPTETDWNSALEDFAYDHEVKYKPATIQWYRDTLRPLIAWCEGKNIPMARFQVRDFERYLVDRKPHVSVRTLEIAGRCTRVFLRYCFEQGYVEKNVLRDYKVPKSPRAIIRKPTTNEVSRLLAAIKHRMDPRNNKKLVNMDASQRRFIATRDYALISGLIETGCRVTEMCNLLLADFDPDAKQILFRETKEGDPKTVPISATWITAVKEWLKVRPQVKDCKTLFMSRCGHPMTKDSVKNQMNAAIKYAKIPHATRHSLRHYTITQVARINVWSAAQMAGHKDLKTTMRYLHTDLEAVRADMNAASVLRNATQAVE